MIRSSSWNWSWSWSWAWQKNRWQSPFKFQSWHWNSEIPHNTGAQIISVSILVLTLSIKTSQFLVSLTLWPLIWSILSNSPHFCLPVFVNLVEAQLWPYQRILCQKICILTFHFLIEHYLQFLMSEVWIIGLNIWKIRMFSCWFLVARYSLYNILAHSIFSKICSIVGLHHSP